MTSNVVIRRARARSRSPPGWYDSMRRTRLRLEESGCGGKDGREGAESALPDDMLVEVFKRLSPLPDIVRCAAVCRRWRRLVSGAGCLPAPPPHFGFFRNYGPSPLPPFVPTAGVGLDLDPGVLSVPYTCGAVLVDCRGRRLLLRELGGGHMRELRLIVCDPLGKTSVRLPSRRIEGRTVACCVLVPGEGAAFRVVLVLFGTAPADNDIWTYSSASSTWEEAPGALKKPMAYDRGPSVVVGDVAYNLQSEDVGYIMAVDANKMTLSEVPLPDTRMLLYPGNHWIGKTAAGRLCFFALREQLILVIWVLEAPGKWVQRLAVDLRGLMNPATVGDLSRRKLSAKISDQLHGCRLVSFGGFCEGTRSLFFVMDDWVVVLDLVAWRMERLWRHTDDSRPLADLFPVEMMVWPPGRGHLGKKE